MICIAPLMLFGKDDEMKQQFGDIIAYRAPHELSRAAEVAAGREMITKSDYARRALPGAA